VNNTLIFYLESISFELITQFDKTQIFSSLRSVTGHFL